MKRSKLTKEMVAYQIKCICERMDTAGITDIISYVIKEYSADLHPMIEIEKNVFITDTIVEFRRIKGKLPFFHQIVRTNTENGNGYYR